MFKCTRSHIYDKSVINIKSLPHLYVPTGYEPGDALKPSQNLGLHSSKSSSLIRAIRLKSRALVARTGAEGKAIRTNKSYARERRAQATCTSKPCARPSQKILPAQHKSYAQTKNKPTIPKPEQPERPQEKPI